MLSFSDEAQAAAAGLSWPACLTTVRTCAQRLLLILTLGTPEIVEFFAGLTAVAWGGWILVKPQIVSHAFLYLHLLPAWFWGAAPILTGGAQLYLLACGLRPWRQVLALFSLMAWLFTGTMRYLADPLVPSIIFYCLLAAANAWVFLRLAIHFRPHEDAPPGGG